MTVTTRMEIRTMTTTTHLSSTDLWPPLPLATWQDTYETLHLCDLTPKKWTVKLSCHRVI
jgi:hypothetical protein